MWKTKVMNNGVELYDVPTVGDLRREGHEKDLVALIPDLDDEVGAAEGYWEARRRQAGLRVPAPSFGVLDSDDRVRRYLTVCLRYGGVRISPYTYSGDDQSLVVDVDCVRIRFYRDGCWWCRRSGTVGMFDSINEVEVGEDLCPLLEFLVEVLSYRRTS